MPTVPNSSLVFKRDGTVATVLGLSDADVAQLKADHTALGAVQSTVSLALSGAVLPYEAGKSYSTGSLVIFADRLYQCIQPTTGEEDPTNTDFWAQIASGIDYATTAKAGLVKVGEGLSVTDDGVLSATAQGLEPATSSRLGGVKVGSNLSITEDGVLSNNYSYTLPTASASVLGGVKVGSGLSISSGVLTASIPWSTGPATGLPNYKARVSVDKASYTAPSNGWVVCSISCSYGDNGNRRVYFSIEGVAVAVFDYPSGSDTFMLPIARNTTITASPSDSYGSYGRISSFIPSLTA